jgi:hypothetical protein
MTDRGGGDRLQVSLLGYAQSLEKLDIKRLVTRKVTLNKQSYLQRKVQAIPNIADRKGRTEGSHYPS